jgi:hypothetical protein
LRRRKEEIFRHHHSATKYPARNASARLGYMYTNRQDCRRSRTALATDLVIRLARPPPQPVRDLHVALTGIGSPPRPARCWRNRPPASVTPSTTAAHDPRRCRIPRVPFSGNTPVSFMCGSFMVVDAIRPHLLRPLNKLVQNPR